MRNHMLRARADLVYVSNVGIVGVASGITSATMPTHQVGDLIILAVTRIEASSSTITNPGGYTVIPGASSIGTESSGASKYVRHGYLYKVAASTSEVTGTWTNASTVTAIVIRGQHASPFGGIASANNGLNSTTAPYPAVTIAATARANYLLAFASVGNATMSIDQPPMGLLNIYNATVAGTHEVAVHGAKKVGSWPLTNVG